MLARRRDNDLLSYFRQRTDKFFVIVTQPPMQKLPQNGEVARSFSNWLVSDWLKENDYRHNNVMVFDLYNVLTSGHGRNKNDIGEKSGNHHRIINGNVQHIIGSQNNLLIYSKNEKDDHPTPAGLQKATAEFVPLLEHYYFIWKHKL